MTWLYRIRASQSNTWTHEDAFLPRALAELETVEENRHKWTRIRLWLGSSAFSRLFVVFVLCAAFYLSLFSVALEHVVGPLGAAATLSNNEGAPGAGVNPSATPPSVHPLHLPFLVPVVMLQLDEREGNWNSPTGHHAAYSVPKLRTYIGRDCLSDMWSNQPPVFVFSVKFRGACESEIKARNHTWKYFRLFGVYSGSHSSSGGREGPPIFGGLLLVLLPG